jgi:hypothetical protein
LPVSQAGQPRPPISGIDEAKHRHFAEQQKRLQEFSSRPAGRKMDADSLIESIIGKSDKQQSSSGIKAGIQSSNTMTAGVGPASVTAVSSSGKFSL